MPVHWNPLRLTAEDRFPVPLAVLLLFIYAGLTLYVGLHHEPWRDEADVWLAARDLTVAEAIPSWTAHEGAPALWFLIVKAILNLGLPYPAQTIINLALAWAAAAVFLLAAPLTRLLKVLTLASYFMAYEYSVIARTYALAILILFLALAAYRSRKAHPLRFAAAVALLFNVNVHGAIIAALLALIFSIPPPRSRRALVAVAVMILGAVAAYLQLRLPAGESNPLAMQGVQPAALVSALRDAFLPAATSAWPALIGLLVIVATALAIHSSWRALLLLIAGITALLALYTTVWFGGLRASGMILIVVITSVWIAADVPRTMASQVAAVMLNATLICSAAFTFIVGKNDVLFAFSGAKEMAQFIDSRFDGHDIAAHGFYQTEALLPYLPSRKFWYIALGEYGTYLKWDAAQRRGMSMRDGTAVLTAKQHFASSSRPWLLLLNKRLPAPEQWGFRPVHATSVVVFRNLDERYWLYEPIAQR